MTILEETIKVLLEEMPESDLKTDVIQLLTEMNEEQKNDLSS